MSIYSVLDHYVFFLQLSQKVVTAEGNLLTISDASNPDLFWATRGSGGAHAVVYETTTVLNKAPAEMAWYVVIMITQYSCTRKIANNGISSFHFLTDNAC